MQGAGPTPGKGRARGPLAGVTVLDLTTVIAGPFATMMLADMGARVIKVEPPAPDTTRLVGTARTRGLGSVFLGIGRGKESVSIDLKTDAGAGALEHLIAGADVLIHNMRPKAALRLGLEPDRIAARHPGLVFCQIAGFDQAGPDRDRPAYDDTIQGASGAVAMMQAMTGEAFYFPTLYVDKTVGLYAASAVLSALYASARTGQGQCVTVPMYETIVAFNLLEHLFGATHLPQTQPPGYPRTLSGQRRPFATADGNIAALPYQDKHFAALFALAGQPGLIGDPRFASIQARLENVSALMEVVNAITRTRTTADWLEAFEAEGIPAMPVRSLPEVLEDPQLRASGLIRERQHPTEGAFNEVGFPVRYSATPPAEARPAAPIGQDTRSVLEEFGVGAGLIDELTGAGAGDA